ncbi:MAG TPA: hypothetical protein VK509_16200 [Polyangiales bacterium]|nr:hypothetical protein [Polyangiales bacterium]
MRDACGASSSTFASTTEDTAERVQRILLAAADGTQRSALDGRDLVLLAASDDTLIADLDASALVWGSEPADPDADAGPEPASAAAAGIATGCGRHLSTR